MILRKVLGVVLIFIGAILSLSIIFQLTKLFSVIGAFLSIFTGSLGAEQIGFALGQMIGYAIVFVLTILTWKYGVRFVSKKQE